MNLTAGIINPDIYWQYWLAQTGVPVTEIQDAGRLETAHTPVLILNSGDLFYPGAVHDYLIAGGSVLTTAAVAAQYRLCNMVLRRIDYLSTNADAYFNGLPPVAFYAKTQIAARANCLVNQNNDCSVAVLAIGKGLLIVLPDGLIRAAARYDVRRINFPTADGLPLPSERVCAVQKSAIRLVIQRALQLLYHHRNLPLVYTWPFPGGADSIFAFRIDTDFASREQVLQLYDLLNRYEIPATWFVETASCRDWVDVFTNLSRQEIALHCYRHAIFSSPLENARDIRTGLAILRGAGLDPRGYAAPFGEWTPSLASAIEGQGFHYSSEFAHSYDNLPHYPIHEHRFTGTLQIPVHPVSVGRLRFASHSPAQMIDYYRNVIQRNAALQIPVILYHHPAQGNLAVFDAIFREIRTAGYPVMPFTEIAQWWQQRSALPFRAHYANGTLQLETGVSLPGAKLAADFPDGTTRLFPCRSATAAIDSGSPFRKERIIFSERHLKSGYSARMLSHDILWHYSRWKQTRKLR